MQPVEASAGLPRADIGVNGSRGPFEGALGDVSLGIGTCKPNEACRKLIFLPRQPEGLRSGAEKCHDVPKKSQKPLENH